MSTVINSDDQDDMQYNATFHQVLHCKTGLQTNDYTIFLESIT